MALDGKGYLGYKQLAEQYGNTAGGNLAKYKAGIASYNLGNYQEAFDYFKDFDTDEEVLSIIRIGAMGDCMVQLNKLEEGLNYYKQAANKSKVSFTTAFYYRKAALLASSMGKYPEAMGYIEKLEEKVPEEIENAELQKQKEYLKNDNKQQSLDRSGGKYGNKGEDAAIAALQMAELQDKFIPPEEEDDFDIWN
ncbi:unnamed protein product [Cyprideis torosa]|uniref:Uncharacterized protein n=1 Tax=Cyprideis torosa TaxID=163714 RepID=A0A7R8WWN5_9CRUS|nr:unnamed protein product [Cyprideis torosa]CAG0908595.1 unnamed protein product [Cyprideis torosa]